MKAVGILGVSITLGVSKMVEVVLVLGLVDVSKPVGVLTWVRFPVGVGVHEPSAVREE